MTPPRLPPALLCISPGGLEGAQAGAWLAQLERAVAAGLRGLILREPRLADGSFLELARAVRARLDAGAGGWLALHDRPHLVAAAGADGVHLGGRSLAPGRVAAWLGTGRSVGSSSHEGDAPDARRGAHHLLHAPVFAVPGKGPGMGELNLARAVESAGVPVWGLGGVQPENVGAVVAAGCRGVAVLRGVFAHADVEARTRAYLTALARAGAPAC